MSDQLRVLFKAVGDLLNADSVYATLSTGGVHNDVAPVDAETPYTVISLNSLTDPTLDRMGELIAIVNVQAVADAEASGTGYAARMADAARDVLHNALPNLAPEWTVRRCEHTSAYRLSTVVDRRRYAVAGGLYRIEADKE